jgi:hypothetical protein
MDGRKMTMMRHNVLRRTVCVAATAGVLVCAVMACDMNVREAGFLNNAGGPYYQEQFTLMLVAPEKTAEAITLTNGIGTICTEARDSNLETLLMVTNKLDETGRKELEAYGVDFTKLPVSMLLRGGETGLRQVFSVPGLLKAEDLRSIIQSPAKLDLRKLLLDNSNYCVVVILDCADKPANARARKAAEAAVAKHREKLPTQTIPIMTVDRTKPGEKYFLAELGLKDETQAPIALVVFGKGRLASSMLTGDDIKDEALANMFLFLNRNASDCTPDAVYVPGSTVDMIMPWTREMDAKMFDAIAKSGAVPDLIPGGGMGMPAPERATEAPAQEPAPAASIAGAGAAREKSAVKESSSSPKKVAPRVPADEGISPFVYLLPIIMVVVLVIAGFVWFSFAGRRER